MVAQPAARQLASFLIALQIDVHGPDCQQRILGAPGLGRGAGQQVFEGARLQRLHAVVDAGHVAVDKGAFLRRQQGERLLRAGAEAVQAASAVERQRARTEELGQFAGGGAAQQVHLEVALLGMHETGGIGQVEPVASADQRHAHVVALDRDRRPQARDGALAIELGQAGAQEQPGAEDCQQQERQQGPCDPPGPDLPASLAHPLLLVSI